MIIVPAILKNSIDDILDDIKKIPQYITWVQLDVLDGTLTKNTAWHVLDEADKLPKHLQYEVHLMTLNPYLYINAWINHPHIQHFILHMESDVNIIEIAQFVHERGKTIGIALNPGTPAARILPFLPHIDSVQIMTVVPGKQGQEFLPEQVKVIDMVRELIDERSDLTKISIAVDGGINDITVADCVFYGANRIGVGSFLMSAIDFDTAYKKIESAIETALIN